MPFVVWAIVLLVVVGLVLWLADIPDPLKTYTIKITVFVAVVIVLLWFLSLFGWSPAQLR